MTPDQKKRMEENRISNAKLAERLAARKLKQQEEAEARASRSANRIQQGYRENAERLNPNPAVTVLDSRGRPKEKSDNHQWLGQP